MRENSLTNKKREKKAEEKQINYCVSKSLKQNHKS